MSAPCETLTPPARPELPQGSASKPRSASAGAISDNPTTEGDDSAFQVRNLGSALHQITVQSQSSDDALRRLLQLLQQMVAASTAFWFQADAAGQLGPEPRFSFPETPPEALAEQLRSLAVRAHSSGTAQLAQARQDAARVAIAVPAFRPQGGKDALVLLIDQAGDEPRLLTSILHSIQFATAYASQLHDTNCIVGKGHDGNDADAHQSLLAYLTRADRAGSVNEATQLAAAHLAKQVDARWVAIGFRGVGGTCRLRGISNRLRFQRGAPLVNAIESVLAETMLVSDKTPMADASPGSTRETQAITELLRITQATAVRCVPLRDESGNIDAAAVAIADEAFSAKADAILRGSAEIWGPRLALLRETHRSLRRRASRWYQSLADRHRRRLLTAVVATVFALLLLPLPHRIKCSCEVQAISRRYIAAPYEGRLEKALVEPGDLVERGQILARMDGREIRLELSGLEAEIGRAAKERDLALATGETSDAQIAELALARLQVKTQLLRDRLANLEVRSPSDGIVISGDPRELEGARLSMGQTLLEVGPLGNMMVEVAVPDADIAYVEVGLPVSLSLDSIPRQKFRGDLVRIHPRAEQRQQENVFIGEVNLDEQTELLLPGMRGRAKVVGGMRPLGWILFHRAIDHLVFRMGW